MPEAKQQPSTNAGNLDITQLQDFMKAMQEQNMAMMSQLIAQAVAQAVTTAVAEYRKPSPEEQAVIDADKKRIMQARINAAKQGEAVQAALDAQQAGCSHTKPNGEHKFRGQVNSDGWAVIRCQQCLIEFRVRPLPQHVAQGLSLHEVKGLTIEHLRAWEANSKEIDKRLREKEAQERELTRTFAGVDVGKPIPESEPSRYDTIAQAGQRERQAREARG